MEAESLVHTLSDTLAGVNANKLVDTPGHVEVDALINTQAYSVATYQVMLSTKNFATRCLWR